jgi:hypothetical protein
MCMGVARTQNPFSFKSVRLPFYYLLAEDKKTRLRVASQLSTGKCSTKTKKNQLSTTTMTTSSD